MSERDDIIRSMAKISPSMMSGSGRHGLAIAVLKKIRSVSKRGCIDPQVFESVCEEMGIDSGAQSRVEAVLPSLGLRLSPSRRSVSPTKTVEALESGAERGKAVAEVLEEQGGAQSKASPWASRVMGLAQRYIRDGSITEMALDGVVRLCGLRGADIEEFTIALEESGVSIISSHRLGVVEAGCEATSEEKSTQEEFVSAEVETEISVSLSREDPGLCEAIEEARSLLERDRRDQRPDRRILTAQEEVGLAALMRGGRSLDTELAEVELAALEPMDERRRAYEALVLHNQRLVYSLAMKFEGQGLELDDLAQHGMRGLLRAAVKFDGGRGHKSSTYATWWIRQSITRALADEGSLIRLPVYFHEKVVKIASAERELAMKGRRAGSADVAVHSGLRIEEVEEVRRLSYRTDSLDRQVRGDTTLLTLVDEDLSRALPSPEAKVLEDERRDEVRGMLSCLTGHRQREVIERRMGWATGEWQTLEVIGEHFGVSRERIRQIEKKALETLREVHVHGNIGTSGTGGKKQRKRRSRGKVKAG